MAEYIERSAAVKAVLRERSPANSVAQNRKLSIIQRDLLTMPAADVAPVVHGEWLLRHEGYGHYWECSVCHTNPCIYVTEHTKFCPNCGAKMDGGDNGEVD